MGFVFPTPDVYANAGSAFSERHKRRVASTDESILECRRGDRRKTFVSDSQLSNSTTAPPQRMKVFQSVAEVIEEKLIVES